jgi:predicted lipid-binding transport protein (Tim44 family)
MSNPTTDDEKTYKPTNVYDLMTKDDDELENRLAGAGQNANNDGLKENLNNSENTDQAINQERKSLLGRMFSKMEAGSLRGSIFAMSSLALGTGCLALPKRFEQMSLISAVTMILIGSFAAYWSLTIMIQAALKAKMYDYSRLVKETLGPKFANGLDITILIYIFGILISYQVISKINLLK